MNYQPLKEVRKNLRVPWYRSPLKPGRLGELSRRSDLQGWLQAGGHLALFVLCGALVVYFWSQSQWLLFILALFTQGTVASFFNGTAVHELGHGTVFRTKSLNSYFLYLFSMISWWDPFDYASSHTYHHRYTLYPEGDRENLLPLHPATGKTFLLQMFTINLMTRKGRSFGKGGFIPTIIATVLGALGKVGDTNIPSNEWLQSLHEDQPTQHQKSVFWSRILLGFHGTVLLTAIVTGWWVLPLVLSVPSYIANWLSYACGMTQHCGLRDNVADFRKNTRSFRTNPIVEFLYWRMNWHIEHHMYAGIPCYNLPKLHREIASDMPEPRTLRGAWKEMLETWRRQQTESDYMFDTPLPVTAGTTQNKNADALEASIGDLAPGGLK